MGRIHGRYKLLGSILSASVAQWTQRGVIRSVQQGTVLIGAGTGSNTSTITRIDLANSVLVWGGYQVNTAAANADQIFSRVTLTNATTVTATRGAAAGGNDAVNFTVLEHWAGVLRSVQYGTVAIGAGNTTGTATITSVLTSKSAAQCLGFSTTNVGAMTGQMLARVDLTNATTVTATIDAATDITTVGFVVVEYY